MESVVSVLAALSGAFMVFVLFIGLLHVYAAVSPAWIRRFCAAALRHADGLEAFSQRTAAPGNGPGKPVEAGVEVGHV